MACSIHPRGISWYSQGSIPGAIGWFVPFGSWGKSLGNCGSVGFVGSSPSRGSQLAAGFLLLTPPIPPPFLPPLVPSLSFRPHFRVPPFLLTSRK